MYLSPRWSGMAVGSAYVNWCVPGLWHIATHKRCISTEKNTERWKGTQTWEHVKHFVIYPVTNQDIACLKPEPFCLGSCYSPGPHALVYVLLSLVATPYDHGEILWLYQIEDNEQSVWRWLSQPLFPGYRNLTQSVGKRTFFWDQASNSKQCTWD